MGVIPIQVHADYLRAIVWQQNLNIMGILIVDKQAIVRQGINSMLFSAGLAKQVYEAGNEQEVLNSVVQNPIEIILLEVNLPTEVGLGIISTIRIRFPAIKILVISIFRNYFLINSILDLGVHGYIFKDDITCAKDLKLALNCIRQNRLYISASLNKKEAYMEYGYEETRPCRVSRSESNFIRLLSEGRNNKYISNCTGLALSSVETYRKRLLKKFKVPNTSALVKYAYEIGLLDR